MSMTRNSYTGCTIYSDVVCHERHHFRAFGQTLSEFFFLSLLCVLFSYSYLHHYRVISFHLFIFSCLRCVANSHTVATSLRPTGLACAYVSFSIHWLGGTPSGPPCPVLFPPDIQLAPPSSSASERVLNRLDWCRYGRERPDYHHHHRRERTVQLLGG